MRGMLSTFRGLTPRGKSFSAKEPEKPPRLLTPRGTARLSAPGFPDATRGEYEPSAGKYRPAALRTSSGSSSATT